MTSRWVTHCLALALVACNKPKPPSAEPPKVSVCAKVADHLVALMPGAEKHPPEATDPLRRVVETRCDTEAAVTEMRGQFGEEPPKPGAAPADAAVAD